jgi:hypothetical protein
MKIPYIIAVVVIVVAGFFAFSRNQKSIVVEIPVQTPLVEEATTTKDISHLIQVATPTPVMLVTNPMEISGKARGFWFFEASFPAKIVDANGTELAAFSIETTDDWMTEEFVNFSVTVPFATSTTATGTLILHNSNPSGEAKYDEELLIPIQF